MDKTQILAKGGQILTKPIQNLKISGKIAVILIANKLGQNGLALISSNTTLSNTYSAGPNLDAIHPRNGLLVIHSVSD